MSEMISILETDLQAYVDGRLNAMRVVEVEAFLAAHPETAERVQAYRAQNHALRALFDAVLDEPLPARFSVTLSRRSRFAAMRAAAAVAWLAIGGLGGYLLHGSLAPGTAVTALADRAAVAHVVYAAEVLHPVEVAAEQEQHLVKWLSKRLGKELRTPDLSAFGYQLVGGRLLPGDKGPAAQFMYQSAGGARLTLYVTVQTDDTAESAFRYQQEDGVHVLYWTDRNLGFALVGESDRARLLEIAHATYRALNF